MKRIFIISLVCLLFQFSFAQIKPNERLTYSASYNMSGLMTQLAQVNLSTDEVKTSKRTFLHLSLEAATFSKWDTYFKIRDLYESYVNPSNLKPGLYKRNIFEGAYSKTEKYIFNPTGTQINCTSKINRNPEKTNSVTIGSNTIDFVTMVYKLRTIDFSKFKNGQVASFVVVFDEKEYPVYIKLMGKEIISVEKFGKKECYILSIGAKTDRLKGKDKNLIWLTTDSKRLPVLIRFSIPVGTGQLSLISATGI
jgi:hypothetical protein